MGIGMAMTSLQTTLILHAIGAPVFFIVTLLINDSLDMFRSLLGAWIPFGLIFSSTCITGLAVNAVKGRRT